MALSKLEIIDSHIHLYAHAHISTLDWSGQLPELHPLKRQRSVNEYREAASDPCLSGFIFVETDRKYDRQSSDWTHPLREISFFARIANGQCVVDEGFTAQDKHLALAMIPWAPVFGGVQVLEQYVSSVEKVCLTPQTFSLIKGFRFLLQNQPKGTMSTPNFLQSMEWLYDHGYSFDLTIDCHSTGLWQIQESIDLMRNLENRGKLPTIILDHCCKPNLCVPLDNIRDTQEFQIWAAGIAILAKFPGTYIKLSGLMSEMPDGSVYDISPVDLAEQIQPWSNVIRHHFGPQRIMFGSDWPVCTVAGPNSGSWRLWRDIIASTLDLWGCDENEKLAVWSGTARNAYKLDERFPVSQL